VTVDRPETVPRPAVGGPASWARFVAGFLILWAVLAGISEFDPSARIGPLVLVGVAAASVAVSMVLDRLSWRDAVGKLGLGRPRLRPLVVSAALSALLLLVFPVTAAITRADLPLVPGWPWALLGILTLHGLAEEMVWRGYAFRRLAEGRPFWRAVWWTMPLIAVTHIPIVVNSGPAIGGGAMIVAAVTAIPFSKLYAESGETIWAPGLLHAAIDSFKLFALPAAALTVFPFLIIIASIGVPLLILLVPRRFWTPTGPEHVTARGTADRTRPEH